MFKFWKSNENELKLRAHIIELDKQLARSQERIRQLEQEVEMLQRLASMQGKQYRMQS